MAVFSVLGALQAIGEDGPIEFGGPRQRSVLGRLLVARGQVVPVGRLISDLWRDQPPPGAAGSIQTYVSHLRRALEPRRTIRTPARLLVTVPPGYALRAEHVDAWRFEDLVRQGSRRLLDGDAAAAVAALEEALALWKGPAYLEFASADWALNEIARLDELRATAVEQRASAVMALGTPGSVIADLRAHLAEHPLREEGWRLLATALYRQGRQGDALAALREARRMLAAELGVDPGPALRRLEAGILAHSPELDLPGPARTDDRDDQAARPRLPRDLSVGDIPVRGIAMRETGPRVTLAAAGAAVPPPTSTEPPRAASAAAAPRAVPTVADGAVLLEISTAGPATALTAAPGGGKGRVRLFGRRSELSLLLDRSEGVALVSGEAGMGKTALVEEAAAVRAGQGARVAIGRCPATRGAPPGWAWTEIFRTLTTAVASDTAESVRGEGFHGRRAVAARLRAAAAEAPVMLVVEDLHRADRETLDTLVDVVAVTAGAAVTVVCTFRKEEAGRLAGTMAALARHEPLRIALRGLRPGAAAGLVTAVAGVPVTRPALTAVATRTGGNPFFLRETARLIAAEGEAAALTTVPAGVRDVLAARLAVLPARVRTVLGEAAVLDAEVPGAHAGGVDLDVLVAVHGGGEDAVLDAAEAALLAGLLVEPGGSGLRFASPVLRDTVYGAMPRLRRARTHARVAAVLERLRPDEAAALAHHHALGGDPVRAARYALTAAERADLRYGRRESGLTRGQGARPARDYASVARDRLRETQSPPTGASLL
ncbi:BTAD domain-containing putative transcriptional regulator [Microbispora triticiradicis]|uniref:BTAD domain-containing putative transcriptional regulator n=1 Tax=Microbispora triticiradicis TaxID=2200763 RepID=UPI001AD67E90|nr:BTAD domain-containing putative transcriptional regulator [Microbispora triticiradicis]MBO4274619.1 AAA family ATPase [Microbispora triticiradicis]